MNLLTDAGRYLMILLMAIYTYLSFRYFGVGEEKKKKICSRQNRLMFLIHALSYVIIYCRTGEERMILFYGAQVFFLFLYLVLYRFFLSERVQSSDEQYVYAFVRGLCHFVSPIL